MRALLVDLLWCIATFLVVTAVLGILHANGVEVPSLPSWLVGV